MVETDKGRCFIGSCDDGEALQAASVLAERCPDFSFDVEDEVCIEGLTTCFNCRYRRWLENGFSCTKEFPPL